MSTGCGSNSNIIIIVCVMSAGAVEYCLPETLNVTCAVDEIIMVTSAQYGRMRSGRCIKQNYGHVGCEADVTAFVEDECSGRRHCQFPVARLLAVAAPCPADVTSYLDADYRCIKGETHSQRDYLFHSFISSPTFLLLSPKHSRWRKYVFRHAVRSSVR